LSIHQLVAQIAQVVFPFESKWHVEQYIRKLLYHTYHPPSLYDKPYGNASRYALYYFINVAWLFC
jgi:hypothetical protein